MTNKHADGRSESSYDGTDGEPITATLFPNYERLSFTPQLFGPYLVQSGEFSVIDIHDQMTRRSNSGYWNYYKLSNGGLYMAPEKDELLRIQWPGNGFDDLLTSEASGVVATLFTLNFMLHEFRAKHLETMYWKLEDFARGHPESQKIRHAID